MCTAGRTLIFCDCGHFGVACNGYLVVQCGAVRCLYCSSITQLVSSRKPTLRVKPGAISSARFVYDRGNRVSRLAAKMPPPRMNVQSWTFEDLPAMAIPPNVKKKRTETSSHHRARGTPETLEYSDDHRRRTIVYKNAAHLARVLHPLPRPLNPTTDVACQPHVVGNEQLPSDPSFRPRRRLQERVKRRGPRVGSVSVARGPHRRDRAVDDRSTGVHERLLEPESSPAKARGSHSIQHGLPQGIRFFVKSLACMKRPTHAPAMQVGAPYLNYDNRWYWIYNSGLQAQSSS